MTFKSTCPGITGRICGVLNSDFVRDVVKIYNFKMHPTMALQFRQKIQTVSLVEVTHFNKLYRRYTANNFGLMYSRKRISQNSFPNLIHIIPKSFMAFCQKLHNPKRNYENQI
jgi:hypothetical protein